MNDTDRASAYLPHVLGLPSLRNLGEEPARFIASGSQLKTLTRGQVLCQKGGRPAGLFGLLSGRVKLSALAWDGAERVLDLVLPGRVFGQAAVILDQPFPLLAQVLCDSRVLLVARERTQEAMTRWPEVAAALLKGVAKDNYRLIHDLEACCLLSAAERLVEFLIKESAPDPARCDRAHVVLPAAKALVASTLNLTAETFSRELRELARRDLIQVERRTVHIPSLQRLREYRRTGRDDLASARRPDPDQVRGATSFYS